MDDDVIWEIKPHTLAKHAILKRYLEAWAPILLQRKNSNGVLYIDGFAGPGEYANKEPGSPIIALTSILNHVLKSNFKGNIYFYFIEERDDRVQHLKKIIDMKYPEFPKGISYKVKQGEFNQIIGKVLDNAKQKGVTLPPCFCFVDPFGWKDLDYKVLARIMVFPKAELFITFMAGFLNRFKESEPHQESLKRLYSDEQILQMKNSSLSTEELQKLVLRIFVENLKKEIKNFTREEILDFSFSAYNETNNLSYYLIHITKSCKGKEVMKNAMFKLKQDGKYSFRDFGFEPGQSSLVSYFDESLWIPEAAEDVFEFFKILFQKKYSTLKLKALPAILVKNKINCETKWIYKASILSHLESEGKIEYISRGNLKRRLGQFPDSGSILFKF